ncbi:MAG: HD domain-containing protein [Acidobacteriaceae bacterium]|nr:HD domain-containing protein [Acidobacteriaceae bacterium]
MKIGRRAGLRPEDFRSLFYALLFKDIGTTGEQETGLQFLAEADAEATLLWTEGSAVLPRRRVLPAALTLLRQQPTFSGVKQLLEKFVSNRLHGEAIRRRRRVLGSQRVMDMGLSHDTADAIGYMDIKWNGGGTPSSRNETIAVLAQIVKLAQTLELLHEAYGSKVTLDLLYRRCKGLFDPGLVAAAMLTFHSEETWKPLREGDLTAVVTALEPNAEDGETHSIDRLCEVFAEVIDTRSQHMMRHSTAVAKLAAHLAKDMGLNEWQTTAVHRAALLHDLGNLTVEPEVLDKAELLTEEEKETINRAPLLTLDLLSSIPGFEEVASTAAMHRERLDGSGQPFGLRGESISLLARILAVAEVAEALAAGRAYRSKHTADEVLQLISEMAPDKLDVSCIAMLRSPEALSLVA